MVTKVRSDAMPSVRPGAWSDGAARGQYIVEVVGRIEATHDAVTLWLALPGTLRAPAVYQPGQFITLALPTSGGNTIYRSYSLCGDGRANQPWEITIKRQAGGVVSPLLHSAARPGTRLRVSGPQGTFTLPRSLDPNCDLVFVALGSGITPIYAMLRAISLLPPASRPRATLRYAYSTPEDAIYGRELTTLDPQQRWLTQAHYVASVGNRIDAARVLADSAAQCATAHWYLCGPADFTVALRSQLDAAGIEPARVHVETFASPRAAASGAVSASSGRRSRVRLADSGRVLEGRAGETLLEILERSGCHPEYSCRAGACGTCRLRVLAGQVSGGTEGALAPQERAAGYVLSCQAQPLGDVTIASAHAGVTPGAASTHSRQHQGRRATRNVLRSGLVAASVALFATAWNLTGQVSAAATSTSSSSSSSSSSSGTTGQCDFGIVSSSCTSLPSGSSGVTTNPTPSSGAPSTSSGASR